MPSFYQLTAIYLRDTPLDLAEVALVDALPDVAHVGAEPVLVADGEQLSGPLRGVDHLLRFCAGDRHRLLGCHHHHAVGRTAPFAGYRTRRQRSVPVVSDSKCRVCSHGEIGTDCRLHGATFVGEASCGHGVRTDSSRTPRRLPGSRTTLTSAAGDRAGLAKVF
jgi:hypothetical protein